jgi:hypothetical protein
MPTPARTEGRGNMTNIKRGLLLLLQFVLITGCHSAKQLGCLGQNPDSIYKWDAGDTLNGVRAEKEISSDFNKVIKTPIIYSMTFDSNNNLWFLNSSKINKFSPDNGGNIAYDLPEPAIRGDIYTIGNHLWLLVELTTGGIDLLDFNTKEARFDATGFFSVYKGDSIVTSYFDSNNSRLWILTSDKKLVSFELVDKKVIEYNSDKISTTNNSKIAYSEGYLWIANINGDSINISRYQFPEFKNGEVILNTAFGRYPPSILFDKNNALIAGDVGKLDIANMFFLDPGYSWDLMIRSNTFILPSEWFQGRYRWVRPIVSFIDAKNNYWFSGFGLVKYDTTSGLWCRYTYDNYKSIPLAENVAHEIWTYFDGWLYSMQ